MRHKYRVSVYPDDTCYTYHCDTLEEADAVLMAFSDVEKTSIFVSKENLRFAEYHNYTTIQHFQLEA